MFIERAEMKRNAKMSLKGRWGFAIGAMVLYYVIEMVITLIAQSPFAETMALYQYYDSQGISYTPDMGVLIGNYIMTVVALLIVSPIMVGWFGITLKISRNEEGKIRDLFYYIPHFFKVVGLYLLIFVKTFLWSLLLFVPGIIASLNYSQAYYILIQNPDIGIVEAIEESKRMMKGNKWRLFVLELSFIGWMLLMLCTFGLLGFWLIPYMSVTFANFHNALLMEQGLNFRKEALPEVKNEVEIQTDDFE